MPASDGNDESPTTNTTTYTSSIITTWCCNARLDVVLLGLAKRREDVGGWNKDDKVVDEMSEILVMSTQ
jgi:hypothetical protein